MDGWMDGWMDGMDGMDGAPYGGKGYFKTPAPFADKFSFVY